MKRFVLSVLSFSVCVSMLVFLSAFFLPDNSIKNSMLGMQRVKLDRLRTIEGKRLVFLGGSNLSHGLNSEEIEKKLGVSVVNMGLHASLGLRYILWSTIDYIRPDDIIIIVPEYSHFSNTFNGGQELLAMVADVIPDHKEILNKKQWFTLFEFVPRYGAGKLCRLHKCLQKNKGLTITNKYTVQGDYLPPESTKPLPFNKGASSMSHNDLNLFTVVEICHFAKCVEDKGATIVMMPPCFQRTSFIRQNNYIKAISSALKKVNLPFIVSPDELSLEDSMFYDTPYHLNASGYPVRTKLVIDALKDIVNRK